MRKSEALVLQWKDVDMLNKRVSISKTLALNENTEIIIQTPKTASSTRSISLDDETVRIMNNWRTIQRSDYFPMGFNTSSEDQYTFTNDKNKLYYPQVVND